MILNILIFISVICFISTSYFFSKSLVAEKSDQYDFQLSLSIVFFVLSLMITTIYGLSDQKNTKIIIPKSDYEVIKTKNNGVIFQYNDNTIKSSDYKVYMNPSSVNLIRETHINNFGAESYKYYLEYNSQQK